MERTEAVMLSHAFWTRRFNAKPGDRGSSLTLNDEPHAVVGVLPASFDFATVFAPGSRSICTFRSPEP